MSEPSTQSTRNRIKGVVAIGAGALLLAGGATTLAYWTSSAPLSAGIVQSGDLDLELVEESAAWTLQGVDGEVLVIDTEDLEDVLIVPGDTLTLTQDLDITLEGDTLAADLTVDDSGLLGEVESENFIVGVTVDGEALPGSSYRLSPEDVDEPVAVVLTLFFQPETTPGLYDTNVELDLSSGVSFTLTQAVPD